MDKVEVAMRKLKLDKANWVPTKISELAKEYSKRVDNPSQSKYDRFVGLEHFVSGDLKIKKWGSTENLGSSMKAFQSGDILFARRNAYLRRASMVDFDGCCSGDAFVIREDHEKVVPGYLAFVMNSDALWDYANSNAAGTMSKRVKWRDLAEYEFLLPPKDQQKQLTELLWSMEHVVLKNLELCSHLDVYFNSWLNSNINAHKNWKRKPLSSVATVQTGVAKNKSHANEIDNIEVPYLRVANVQDGYLDLNEVKSIVIRSKDQNRFLLQDGDVLLTEGGDFDKLGRGYVWQNEIPNCVHQNHVFSVRTNKEILLPWFLSLVTRSSYGKQYFLSCAKKTSNLASINSSQLKELRVLLPHIDEQNEIVDQYQQIKSTMESANKKLSHSKMLQKSLINQIF